MPITIKEEKSWTYCKSTIEVTYAIWKRGHCSITDLIYVTIGQMILFFCSHACYEINFG